MSTKPNPTSRPPPSAEAKARKNELRAQAALLDERPKCPRKLAAEMAELAGRADEASITALGEFLTDEASLISQGVRPVAAYVKAASEAERHQLPKLRAAVLDLLGFLDRTDPATLDRICVGYAETMPDRRPLEDDDGAVFKTAVAHAWLASDHAAIRRLHRAVEQAAESVVDSGGRPPSVRYMAPVARSLAEKFEDLSGWRFTFRVHINSRTGRHGWLTPGSRFVAMGLGFIFPNATGANITTTMRKNKGNNDLQKPPS